MNTYYVDGAFVAEKEAVLPVTDLAVLRGYGVFDFLRTYRGIPFHLTQHLQRLDRSAKLIGLELPNSLAEIEGIVDETLDRNGHPEANIRLLVTGGESLDGITPADKSRLMVMVTPVKEMPANWYSDGVKIITAHMDRMYPGSKSINYIPAIMNLREAASRDAIESIYVDRLGRMQEGTTSNFLAFFGDTLVTAPGHRILPGVTRQVVLELAEAEFNVEVRDIHQDEVRLMDEAALTSSNKEVVPVVQVDSVPIATGRPGERVARLMALFKEYTDGYGRG